MSQKKLPSELSAEELMKALETNDVSEVDTRSNTEGEVVKFLQEYDIKTGEYCVSCRLLHSLYRKWALKKLNKNKFIRNVSMYIKFNKASFYVDKNTFELAEKLKELSIGREIFKLNSSITTFLLFKKTFKIESGKYYIQPAVLYYLYDNWAYETGHKYFTFITFVKICKFHFDLKISSDSSTWFCISDDIKEFLTEEKLEKALDWAEKHYGKDAKKKQQKKNEEISSSGEESKSEN